MLTVDLRTAGDALARESARFASLGWMRGTSGNLSLVTEIDPLRLAVTASGKDKGELTSEDIVVVDADGNALDPEGPKPSAEAVFHARIVELTGARAVVHVHHLGAVVAADRFPGGNSYRRSRDAEGHRPRRRPATS